MMSSPAIERSTSRSQPVKCTRASGRLPWCTNTRAQLITEREQGFAGSAVTDQEEPGGRQVLSEAVRPPAEIADGSDRASRPMMPDCQRCIIQLITFPEFTAFGYLVIPETT